MAMQIEKYGVDLVAIYRPLNNIFLNKIMEKIRINYICKNQIPKGKVGSRKLLECFKNALTNGAFLDPGEIHACATPFLYSRPTIFSDQKVFNCGCFIYTLLQFLNIILI